MRKISYFITFLLEMVSAGAIHESGLGVGGWSYAFTFFSCRRGVFFKTNGLSKK